jgi:hypothetical protein
MAIETSRSSPSIQWSDVYLVEHCRTRVAAPVANTCRAPSDGREIGSVDFVVQVHV